MNSFGVHDYLCKSLECRSIVNNFLGKKRIEKNWLCDLGINLCTFFEKYCYWILDVEGKYTLFNTHKFIPFS